MKDFNYKRLKAQMFIFFEIEDAGAKWDVSSKLVYAAKFYYEKTKRINPDGRLLVPEWLSFAIKKRQDTFEINRDGILYFKDPKGDRRVNHGDWIALCQNGDFYVYSDKCFRARSKGIDPLKCQKRK